MPLKCQFLNDFETMTFVYLVNLLVEKNRVYLVNKLMEGKNSCCNLNKLLKKFCNPWRNLAKKKCLNQGCWQGGHSLLLFSEIHGNASSKGPSALYIFSVAVPFMPGLLFLILSVFWKVIDVGYGGEVCVWIGQTGSCALFSSPIFHLLSFFGGNWFFFCTLWVIFD